MKNIVGFHAKLEQIASYDLILSEYKLKGVKGDAIYTHYKDILNAKRVPFALIDRGLERETRHALLISGISELYHADVKPEMILERNAFLKSMLDARLSVRKKNIYREYDMPWEKRIFDIVVAGFAILLLSPIFLLTILLIKLESKGPILYISKRVGTGYRVFDFYKFRSMYIDAAERLKEFEHLNQYKNEAEKAKKTDKQKANSDSPSLVFKDGSVMSEEEYLELKKSQQAGTFIKIKDDPRISKVGKFIRNTSIDELPQLFNVLKGDMSIVGNRPLPLYEAEQLTNDDWGERFLAPAGITGLWQVQKRGKGSMSEEERKALDNEYAKNFSFWNDIKLILRTVPALFQKENV